MHMITTDNETINKINWSAVLHAMIFFLCPRNCPATTAPPVANAENRLIINTITLSTNETPDTASSPTFAVMIESASPTVTVSICSMINGMISRTRSLFENILFLALSVISILFPFFFCVLKIISVFCLLFYSFYLITLLILFKV